MDLKTKKKISLFGILAFFFLLCAASVYVYLQVGKGKEVFFVSIPPIFAFYIVLLYYFGKGKKEVKPKHIGLQLFIIAIGFTALILCQISLPLISSITDPAVAFLYIWEDAVSWFFLGLMFVLAGHHTDEIAEKFKRKNTDDSKQNE